MPDDLPEGASSSCNEVKWPFCSTTAPARSCDLLAGKQRTATRRFLGFALVQLVIRAILFSRVVRELLGIDLRCGILVIKGCGLRIGLRELRAAGLPMCDQGCECSCGTGKLQDEKAAIHGRHFYDRVGL